MGESPRQVVEYHLPELAEDQPSILQRIRGGIDFVLRWITWAICVPIAILAAFLVFEMLTHF